MQKRPDKGLLAGMYEFPWIEGYATRKAVLEFVKQRGLSPLRIRPAGDAKHIFSHVEWHMKGYVIFVEEPYVGEDYLFAEPRELRDQYAIPAAYAKYL